MKYPFRLPFSPRRGSLVFCVCFGLSAVFFLSSCAGLHLRRAAKPKPAPTQKPGAKTQKQSLWQPLPDADVGKLFPYALAYNPATKTIFFTDLTQNRICIQNPDGTIGVFTQSTNLGLSSPLAMEFVNPMMLIIADTRNKRICALTSQGIAQDLVKSKGRVTGIVVGSDGAIYYSDFDACTVVRAASDETQTVVAGVGSPGFSGDGADGTSAALNGPYGLALYKNRLFIADSLNQRIRVLDLKTGVIQTFAGNGTRGTSLPSSSMSGLDVALNEPRDVTVDAEGNVYALNTFGASIACFDPSGKFIPERIKADLSGDARPACGLVIDGHFVYTDLLTPSLPRAVSIAAEIPAVAPTQAQAPPSAPKAKAKPAPAKPAKQAAAPPAKQAKQKPPAPAKPKAKPPAKKSAAPPVKKKTEKPATRPAPKTTTLRLDGPDCVANRQSAGYTLVLDLAANVRIGAVVAEVRWDPQQLKLMFAVPRQGPTPDSRRTHISQTENSVTFTMHTRAGTSPPSGTIELCDLLFECRADPTVPTVIPFDIPAPTVISLDGARVATQAESFDVTNFLYGDVSRDNKINLMDTLLLLHSGDSRDRKTSESMMRVGDVDLDGELTVADAFAVARITAGNGPSLPTTPPRKKAGWSDKDETLQDSLASELTGETPFHPADKSEQEKEDLRAEWSKKLVETGAALFIRVPKQIPTDQRELLLDVMLDLPSGKHLGAFEAGIDFDPDRVSVEKILMDDQGPEGLLGKGEISGNRVILGGVCQKSGDKNPETIKLAGLLVSLKPPANESDWETTLHPIVARVVDHQGSALFGFGVPATIRSYRLGDITQDGKVDSVDLVLLLDSLTGRKNVEQLRSTRAADVDGDGEETIRDAVLLANLVDGKDLFDVTTPPGKEIAAKHAVRRILSGQEERVLLPPMIDLLEQKSAAKTVDEALKTHGVIELKAPMTPGSGGYFLGTVEYQPLPNHSLGGYRLVVECDPKALSIETVMPAASMESTDQPLVYHISKDRNELVLAQIPNRKADKKTRSLLLASILFLMKAGMDDPPTSASIRLTHCGLLDRQGEAVEALCPSHTVANFLPGDVNDDGSVERLDEVLLTRFITGEIEKDALKNPMAADLNLDGNVDVSDVVLLEQATLGKAGQEAIRKARRHEALTQEISKE